VVVRIGAFFSYTPDGSATSLPLSVRERRPDGSFLCIDMSNNENTYVLDYDTVAHGVEQGRM
jgi:hypothetical protein